MCDIQNMDEINGFYNSHPVSFYIGLFLLMLKLGLRNTQEHTVCHSKISRSSFQKLYGADWTTVGMLGNPFNREAHSYSVWRNQTNGIWCWCRGPNRGSKVMAPPPSYISAERWYSPFNTMGCTRIDMIRGDLYSHAGVCVTSYPLDQPIHTSVHLASWILSISWSHYQSHYRLMCDEAFQAWQWDFSAVIVFANKLSPTSAFIKARIPSHDIHWAPSGITNRIGDQ